MNGLTYSIEDLKNLIGQLTIDLMALRQENKLLKDMLTALKEGIANQTLENENKSEG